MYVKSAITCVLYWVVTINRVMKCDHRLGNTRIQKNNSVVSSLPDTLDSLIYFWMPWNIKFVNTFEKSATPYYTHVDRKKNIWFISSLAYCCHSTEYCQKYTVCIYKNFGSLKDISLGKIRWDLTLIICKVKNRPHVGVNVILDTCASCPPEERRRSSLTRS